MATDKKKQVLNDLSSRIAQLKDIKSNVKASQTMADLEDQAKNLLSIITEIKSLAEQIDSISKQEGLGSISSSIEFAEGPCNTVLDNTVYPFENIEKGVQITKKLLNSSVDIIYSSLRLGERFIKGEFDDKNSN